MSLEDWFPSNAPFPITLKATTRLELGSEAAARELLLERRGPGWICTVSEVRRVSGERHDVLDGTPLSAEIVLGPRSSLHLRQHRGAWRAWVLEDIEGGPELAFDRTFLSTATSERRMPSGSASGSANTAPPKLCYRSYYRKEASGGGNGMAPIGVWRPFAFRFLGFEETY